MDLRDIQRLHEHYNQPALTIEMPVTSDAPPTFLGFSGPAAAPDAPPHGKFALSQGMKRLAASVAFLAAAAAVGMLTASILGRGGRTTEPAVPIMAPQPEVAPAVAASQADTIHWPAQPASQAVSAAQPAVMPAPQASAPQTQQSDATQPRQQVAPQPIQASRPAVQPAPSRTPPAVAEKPPTSPKTREASDIKLF
ncbi:hypothetical protein [Cupriavidus sp. D39]|uniref:hypothetical protein n=1 Tax=Cupriavidus sp. D39 TaxID=2997877 RepID=UPI0022719994|nr:hypothetical protein [Cupriavidus sp. D39]MCY0852487.1 hypothetical protein [Cupriavidus sp. D39]